MSTFSSFRPVSTSAAVGSAVGAPATRPVRALCPARALFIQLLPCRASGVPLLPLRAGQGVGMCRWTRGPGPGRVPASAVAAAPVKGPIPGTVTRRGRRRCARPESQRSEVQTAAPPLRFLFFFRVRWRRRKRGVHSESAVVRPHRPPPRRATPRRSPAAIASHLLAAATPLSHKVSEFRYLKSAGRGWRGCPGPLLLHHRRAGEASEWRPWGKIADWPNRG